MFWISPNLAKYFYGWLSLEQHHTIHKILKKMHTHTNPEKNLELIITSSLKKIQLKKI